MASHTVDSTLDGLLLGERPGESSDARLALLVERTGDRSEEIRGFVTVAGAPRTLGEIPGAGVGHG